MNIKSFFVATLSTALDLGIAAPEDVLRHVTTDVLSTHLPRPLWARLLTACLGAPRVDATLVVETIGVPNLCEHIPSPIIWACIAEVARRSLGGQIIVVEKPSFSASAAPPAMPASDVLIVPVSSNASSGKPAIALTPPPPPTMASPVAPPPPAAVVGTSIPTPGNPLADVVAELEAEQQRDDRPPPPPSRARTPTGQRFRQSNTGIGRLAANNTRRPQASALPTPVAPTARRGQTESDSFEIESETSVGTKEDWKAALAVEEDQLVDWQHTEETVTHGDEYTGRKR